MHKLTKSLYTTGIECPRLLWKKIHQPETLPPFDKVADFRFKQGNIIGDLARKLYPKGILLPEEQEKYNENLTLSQEAIKNRQLCFEPGVEVNNLFARADILIPTNDNEWDLIEVKSAKKVSDKYLHDLSFQKYVYELAGIKINQCKLMLLNGDFVKQGPIDPKELLVEVDVTQEVNKISEGIEDRIKNLQEIINNKEPPTHIHIGSECKNGKKCICEDCHSFLPEDHVFELVRGGKKSLELFEAKVLAIKDIPDEFKLTKNQNIQRQCAKTNQVHINKEEIKQFLDKLKYPIYYLDFEGFSTAVPIHDSVKSYQHIPFQYSIHIDDGNKVTHKEFLHDSIKDPRRIILDKLKQDLGGSGSIVVFSQTYEKQILNQLAQQFPEDEIWVELTKERIVDLLIPFRNFSYYNPKQKGSASLKKVLPAITGKDYSHLNIADGELAYITFLDTILTDMSPSEIKQTRKDLLEYCKLDTEGMVWIVEELRKLLDQ